MSLGKQPVVSTQLRVKKVFRCSSAVDDLTANWWNFTNVDAVSLVDLQQFYLGVLSLLMDVTAAMKENQNLLVMVIVRPQSEWCLNTEPVILLVPPSSRQTAGL